MREAEGGKERIRNPDRIRRGETKQRLPTIGEDKA